MLLANVEDETLSVTSTMDPLDGMGHATHKNTKPLHLVVSPCFFTNSRGLSFFCKHYFGLCNLANNLRLGLVFADG